MGVLYIVLMIGPLILIHELGHYMVARWMKVHVVEFSIGIGPKIFGWKGKSRHPTLPPTQYVLALLPFGGFVKMLGFDPNDPVPEGAEAVSFGRRPVWRRFLIMIAGPAMNLVLPFFLFFIVGLAEGTLRGTTIGSVEPDSPAEQGKLLPGDTIIGIGGEPIRYWWQLSGALSDHGDADVDIEVLRLGKSEHFKVRPKIVEEEIVPKVLTRTTARIGVMSSYERAMVGVIPGSAAAQAGIRSWDRIVAVGDQPVDYLYRLFGLLEQKPNEPVEVKVLAYESVPGAGPVGIALAVPRTVVLPASPGEPRRGLYSGQCVVHKVIPGSPAALLGLVPGDRILKVDDRACRTWAFTATYLHQHREAVVQLTWQHGDVVQTKPLVQREVEWPTVIDRTAKTWIHGIQVQQDEADPEPIANEDRLTFALYRMTTGTFDAIAGTLATLGGLFTGRVSVHDGLGSAPLIAHLAVQAGNAGWDKFLALMAGISVSLGLINLLPIPVLDGGQILFLAIEGVRRRPVSLRTRMIATYMGLAFIVVLMIIKFRDDIAHIWGG